MPERDEVQTPAVAKIYGALESSASYAIRDFLHPLP
jgi:hypothetical protein